MQLILDGQATPEQEAKFKEHINTCAPCLKDFELDQAIKIAIQKKCECLCAPEGLHSEIKGALQKLD